MSDMTGAFMDELEEQLQIMETGILDLERSQQPDAAIQNLFRAAHTLKGSSAAMGIDEMKDLTHEMEHVLDQARHGVIPVSHDMVELLLSCFDCLRTLKDEFASDQGISTSTTALAHQLHRFVDEQKTQAQGGAGPSDALHATLSDLSLHAQAAQAAYAQGRSIVDIDITFSAFTVMRAARLYLFADELAALGTVLWTSPPLDDFDDQDDAQWGQCHVYIGVDEIPTDAQMEVLRRTDFDRLAWNVVDASVFRGSPDGATRGASGSSGSSGEPGLSPVDVATDRQALKKSRTIRVDVQRLEDLMNLAGELVIDQTRIAQISGNLNRLFASNDHVKELSDIANHVSRVVSDLQESVMRARMMTLEQLFGRFPRMVRDLAQSLQKEIELRIEGQETQLDRTVIEEISDPLIHLIRNAVDHGIESPEVRLQNHKPSAGTLTIAALQEGSNVVITIEDDGAGIDPQRLRDSAVTKGIATTEEVAAMSDAEAIALIFRPGFSTASIVSDVSGRGVGMDVVKTNIEKLQGHIDTDSRLGAGTRFSVTLPLTLSIISGLLIRVGAENYVLPMGSVIEIVRVKPETLISINGQAMIDIRDRLIPVKWLHDLLNVHRVQGSEEYLSLVVIGSAEKRLALVIDELHGHQEIVKKPLGSLGRVDCISGATILGDGRVAAILDAMDIIHRHQGQLVAAR